MRDPRINRIFDQAVMCTHDRSAMRSEMTAWRVPRTAHGQRLLHTTSAIIDTDVRQRTTRDLQKWVKEQKNPGSTGLVFADEECGGGLRLTHNGKLPNMKKSKSSPSASDKLSEHRSDSQPYLPPWVSRSQWEQAVRPPPPKWAGAPWAIVSGGPGSHWAGAQSLPSRQGTPSTTGPVR
jgi:hypothetical protein